MTATSTPRRSSPASEGNRIVDEEQFGPALPILPYRDLARRSSGRTPPCRSRQFGLVERRGRAHEVAEQLEAGTTWINTHAGTSGGAPFMGRKWSGLGARRLYSVDAYSDLHTIVESTAGRIPTYRAGELSGRATRAQVEAIALRRWSAGDPTR